MEGLVQLSEKSLDKLFRKNALLDVLGNEGQQIVVVGDTSTGKSTVINFLLGFPINFEASGIGTRRPCVLTQVQQRGLRRVQFEARFCKAGETFIVPPTGDAREVAALVAKANDSVNTRFFDCLPKNCDKEEAYEKAFDHEPVYVKMMHEDFKYGLRLIDLPGLTRRNTAPMHIAETYIQPGNVAILVMGKDNAANGGFPDLCECMTKCSQVLVIQNFAENLLKGGNNCQDNQTCIKTTFQRAKSNHANNLVIYCVDFGLPKTAQFLNDNRWKQSTDKEVNDQENWQEMASTGGLEVQRAMYSHAHRWGLRLRKSYPNFINEHVGFEAGITPVLRKVIDFQLEGIDDQIQMLIERVKTRIEQKEDEREELQEQAEKLKDPPEWQDLLSKLAKVVSEFLDTTIAIPEEKEDAEVFKSLQSTAQELEETVSITQRQPRDRKEEDNHLGDPYWFDEDLDAQIKALVGSECEMEAKLCCLRSWHRLLDELTAMLAFAPMPCVSLLLKRQAFSRVGSGAAADLSKLDTMVELVSEAKVLGKPPVLSLLRTFKMRFLFLATRDLRNAVRMFKQDLTHEIEIFLTLIGDNTQQGKDRLVTALEEGLLENMRERIRLTIDGSFQKDKKGRDLVDKVSGRRLIEPRSGLCVRLRENEGSNQGPCHWLIPFKSHYVNGQIPWQDLCMSAGGGDNSFSAPENSGPIGRPELDDNQILAEVAPPRTMNAVNAVNMKIYELATGVYDIPLGFNDEDFSIDLEVIKMLKAMQAEIAAFWASTWKSMVQQIKDPQTIARDVELAVLSKLKEVGLTHSVSPDSVQELTDSYKRALSAVNGVISGKEFPDTCQMTTFQEISDAGLKQNPWPGLDESTYKELLEIDGKEVESFPASKNEPCAGEPAWIRLCSEFIFVILQLAMKKVSHEELSMSRASSGKAILAGPFEIVTKLVLHRLRGIGQDSGNVFKLRMTKLYERDLQLGMKEIEKYTLAMCGPGTSGCDFVREFLRDRTKRVVARTLASLQAKFNELMPFDFSILNGRLPLLDSPVRVVDFEIIYENRRHEARLRDDDETKAFLMKVWHEPLREQWKELAGVMTVHEEKRKDRTGLVLDKATNAAAFACLSDEKAQESIEMFAHVSDDNPPGGDKAMAGGAFHSMLIRIHKAMHVNAIDYCRPKIKEMMAHIYQEEHIRGQLQRNKFLGRRMWEELAEKKIGECNEINERIKIMKAALIIATESPKGALELDIPQYGGGMPPLPPTKEAGSCTGCSLM